MNTDGATGVASNPSVSTVPFVNNCPPGIQPSGGWDIRNPVFGMAISVKNFPTADIGKPIVLALNVPSGYTTVGTTILPGALIGQAQEAYSQGESAIVVSTSACTTAPNPTDFQYQGGSRDKFVTPDDPRSKSEKYATHVIIP